MIVALILSIVWLVLGIAQSGREFMMQKEGVLLRFVGEQPAGVLKDGGSIYVHEITTGEVSCFVASPKRVSLYFETLSDFVPLGCVTQ